MVRIIPLLIASLLLAAHFLRDGNIIGLVVVTLLMPLLLLIKKRWSLIVLQVAACVAASVWLYTMIMLVQERMMFGRRWGIAVIILGSVALFTILSGVLLNSRSVRNKYPSRDSRPSA